MADDLSNPTLSAGATPLPEGRTHLGRYRVVRLLGRGAMGIVYEGEADDGAKVALKVLPGWVAADADELKRFLREAQAVARGDAGAGRGVPRAGGGARGGDRPPRRQARQHPAGRGRHGQARRLRAG